MQDGIIYKTNDTVWNAYLCALKQHKTTRIVCVIQERT